MSVLHVSFVTWTDITPGSRIWRRWRDFAGLSPFHFHRLFPERAAMTSREFLQYLTLFHARDLLREGKGVLETA